VAPAAVAPTMSMRVGFASGTRPGPPIEERKSCERGRLKAPPRREGEAGPLTLLTDWSTRLIALYLPSRHEVAVVLIILLVPPPVASWLVMRHTLSFGHDVTRHNDAPDGSGAARRSASSTAARFVNGSGVP
jgi:hypothetical protein